MNVKSKSISIALLALVAVLGLHTGCGSKGYEQAADTGSTLTKSAGLITQGNALIDQCLAALTDLVANPQADLRPQYKAFDAAVTKLRDAANDVGKKAEAMKKQGAGYFKNWDAEMAKIQNEDIRSRSAGRKGEVAAAFGAISQAYDGTKAAFLPFMSDLSDIQKYLATDLTPGGLATIKDIVPKATEHGQALKEVLNALSGDFKALGLSLSPVSAVEK